MQAILKLVRRYQPRMDTAQMRLVYDNIPADELFAAIREDSVPAVEEKIGATTITANGDAKSARSKSVEMCAYCHNPRHRGLCKAKAQALKHHRRKAS